MAGRFQHAGLALSYADAAQALNVPIGTLMSRLHRGRERLLALLADPGQLDRAPESSSLSKVVP